VKTQCVKTALKQIHSHEHTNCCEHEHVESEEQADEVTADKAGAEAHVEEDFSQLAVSQRQSPQTQVGGGIGNGTQDELDCLDALVNEQLTERVGRMTEIPSLGNDVRVEAEGIFSVDYSCLVIVGIFEAIIVVMVVGVDVREGMGVLWGMAVFRLVSAIDVVHHQGFDH